jgi:hypothetical protein
MTTQMHSTTIICVRKGGKVPSPAMAGDAGRHGHKHGAKDPAALWRQITGLRDPPRTVLPCFAVKVKRSSFTKPAGQPSNGKTGGRIDPCVISAVMVVADERIPDRRQRRPYRTGRRALPSVPAAPMPCAARPVEVHQSQRSRDRRGSHAVAGKCIYTNDSCP